MTKHTPGPWTVHPTYHSDCEYNLYDKDGNFCSDTSSERMDSNAKLIAAAPDLLEAAQNAEFLLRKLATNWKEARFLVDSASRGAAELREAIAKAEGNE